MTTIQIEYVAGRHGFSDATSLIRWAQTESLTQMSVLRFDGEWEPVTFHREGDVWVERDADMHEERWLADPSSDPMALLIVDLLEGFPEHAGHQLLVRYRPDEWPPPCAEDLDPIGRWSALGWLPPLFRHEIHDDAQFETHYCPDLLASRFRAAEPGCTLDDADIFTRTLYIRHCAAVARAELPFHQREREADDCLFDSTNPELRSSFVALMLAAAS